MSWFLTFRLKVKSQVKGQKLNVTKPIDIFSGNLHIKPPCVNIGKRSNGVTFALWGISSNKVSKKGSFSLSDLNKRKLFNIIPADEFVSEQLNAIVNKKNCWKAVSITGNRINKIEENGIPSQMDLGFFYLSSIDSSF